MKPHEKAILEELFSEYDYDGVKPLTEGNSGAEVLRVRGILDKGNQKRNYVVKIGEAGETAQEEGNYKKHILQGETAPPYQILTPIEEISKDKSAGYLGVVYRDAKDFLVSETVSFHEFWGEQSQKHVGDVDNLLKGLIDFYTSSLFDETEKKFRHYYTMEVLPFELRLEWCDPERQPLEEIPLKKLTDMANTPQAAQGLEEQWVRCDAEFTVIEADAKKVRFSSDEHPCKIDVVDFPIPDSDPASIIGRTYPCITGKVTATRIGFLTEKCETHFPGVNWQEKFVELCGTTLPNPLCALYDILNRDYSFQSAIVHGDLNLENILVGHRYSNPDYVLIDYAKTRPFHAPYDFIKLEVDLRTHLLGADKHLNLSKLLDFELDLLDDKTSDLTEEDIRDKLYHHTLLQRTFSLIKQLRKLAREELSENDEMPDYFAGLFCYALATLKFDFKDENPLQRQSAIIAASVAAAYLQGESEKLLNARREIRRKQLKKDEYIYLFLSNIGTSDLQIQPDLVKAGENELSSVGDVHLRSLFRYAKRKVNPQDPNQFVVLSKPYRDGETINSFYDWFKDKMGAMILKPALAQVLSDLKGGRMRDIPISRVYLFATKLSGGGSDSDTIYCADVLSKLIKDSSLAATGGSPTYHQIETLKIEQIGEPPASYSRMWSYFEQKLRDLFNKHDQEIIKVYVCLSGGTPASNTTLLLNALQLWGHRCIPVYTERPEGGQIYGPAKVLYNFGQNLRQSFLRDNLKILLDKREYAALLHFEDAANFSDGFIRLCNAASAFSNEGFSDWQEALNLLKGVEKAFGREYRNTREQIRDLRDDLTQQTTLDVEESRSALHNIILSDFHRQFGD